MARRLPPLRRVTTAARWPLGVALTSWRYLWRTTPMHRRERAGRLPDDAPPALPPGVARGELQPADDGVGPLFHRRYRIAIAGARLPADDLMERLQADLNVVAPTELAVFHRLRGEPGTMAVGDEYLVRIPGPWDGPVRVVAVTPASFRFATLEGHLEAGQIEFRVEPGDAAGSLAFEIESWARSGSRLSNLLYHRLRMAKEVQLHMWTSLLGQVARLAGGRRDGPLEIETRVVPAAPGPRTLRDARARRALDELHDVPLNYDPASHDGDAAAAAAGWNVDDWCVALPPEPPGAPSPDGSWAVACRLMRDYELADPRIVRAVYHPDQPLAERDMLLEARFLGLRFRFGVRVAGVVDETRTVDGRPVRVWGWSYRTLQRHLEMGEMDFEAWKWVDDGAVEFRIHAVSRAAHIPNPLVRLGFRLFGRSQQRRFARHALERMERLTAAELADDDAGADRLQRVGDAVAVAPAADAGARSGAA